MIKVLDDDVDLYFEYNSYDYKTANIIKELIECKFNDEVANVDVDYDGKNLTITFIGNPDYRGIISTYLRNLFDNMERVSE